MIFRCKANEETIASWDHKFYTAYLAFVADDMDLMNLSRIDTLMVQPGVPVQGHAHILVNDIPTDNPHGSTISLQFVNVWKYMLNADTGKD